MTHDELEERVARRLAQVADHARVAKTSHEWFLPEARAAISIIRPAVLEEVEEAVEEARLLELRTAKDALAAVVQWLRAKIKEGG
jgi:hypothetical protein